MLSIPYHYITNCNWRFSEVTVHDSVAMVTGDLFMLRHLQFLIRVDAKLTFEQVILSNPVLMRQGSELIKTGSFVISRTNSRGRHRWQTGPQIKLYYHPSVKALCLSTWVLSHYSVHSTAAVQCYFFMTHWEYSDTTTHLCFSQLEVWNKGEHKSLLVVGLLGLSQSSPLGKANVCQSRRINHQYKCYKCLPNRTVWLQQD